MTIDSLHEASNERIDSCFKLSRRGGVAVTKSTSLSLLPAPINRIYSHSREILPFPSRQKPRQDSEMSKGIQAGLIIQARHTEAQAVDH